MLADQGTLFWKNPEDFLSQEISFLVLPLPPPHAAAADTILTPVLEPINHLSPGATVSGFFPFDGMRPINSKMSFQKYLKTSVIFWLYHLRRGNQMQWSGDAFRVRTGLNLNPDSAHYTLCELEQCV